mmetsp:Transcript_8800/g.17408  ORF Transcript_8800/g.17408 Transcript_8800/m.17408 type:complete len:230 (+) Transcript_8800:439-1128(+)
MDASFELVSKLLNHLSFVVVLVLAKSLLLLKVGEELHSIVAHIVNGILGLLVHVHSNSSSGLAGLLGDLGQRHINLCTLHRRVQVQVCCTDGIAHGRRQALIKHVNHKKLGGPNGALCHGIKRGLGSIGFHHKMVEHRGVGASRAQLGKLMLKSRKDAVHVLAVGLNIEARELGFGVSVHKFYTFRGLMHDLLMVLLARSSRLLLLAARPRELPSRLVLREVLAAHLQR